MSHRLPKPPTFQLRFLVRKGDIWFFKRCRHRATWGNLVTSFGAVGELLMIGMKAGVLWHVGFLCLLACGVVLLSTGARTVVDPGAGRFLTSDGRLLNCGDIEALAVSEELEWNTQSFDRWGSLYAHSGSWEKPELLTESITPDRLAAAGAELAARLGVPWLPPGQKQRKKLRAAMRKS